MHQNGFLTDQSFALLELVSGKRRYLREIAEKEGLAPSTVHKTLSKLLAKKILLSENDKNRKIFRINTDSALAQAVMRTITIDRITSSTAFGRLAKMKPLGIYLFGSAAEGKMAENSDIDLAIYFSKAPNSLALSSVKRELSSSLKKEIQLIILTKERIKEMANDDSELLKEIKRKAVTLWGNSL